MKKYFLFLLLVLCTSCIEVEQEIWIYRNGSGRIRVAFGTSKTLHNLMNRKSKEDQIKTHKEHISLLKKNPNVSKAEITEYEKGDLWFYNVDVTVKDLRDAKQLRKDLETIFSSKGKRPGRETTITVEKLNNGNYLFLYAFSSKKEEATLYAKKVNKLFAGKNFTFRLHAPHIVSSNGYRNKKENMVEWKFPMVDMLEQKGDFLPKLKAEIKGPNILLWASLGIIVLGLLTFIGIKYRK